MKIAAFILVLLISSGIVSADEPEKPIVDPRLDKKITVNFDKLMMAEALTLISGQSGVELKTEKSKQKWWVAELPLSMHCKDTPVSKIKDTLAKMQDLRWRRTGEEGKWTYTLWQDKNAEERENALFEEQSGEPYRKLAGNIDNTASMIEDFNKMTPEEQKKALAENGFLKFLTQDPFGQAYAGMVSVFGDWMKRHPASTDSERSQSLPFDRFSTKQQAAFQNLVQQLSGFMQKVGDSNQSLPADLDWGKTRLEVTAMNSFPGAEAMVSIKTEGGRDLDIPLFDPNSPMSRFIGDMVMKVQAGMDPKALEQQMGSEMQKMEMEAGGALGPSKDKDGKYSDPRLEQMIEPEPVKDGEKERPVYGLPLIADKTGLCIVADAFKEASFPLRGKTKVGDFFDLVARVTDSKWNISGDVVTFDANNRVVKRFSMVPVADIEYWKSKAQTYGEGDNVAEYIPLESLAESVGIYSDLQAKTLRESQIRHLLTWIDDKDQRDALRLFRTLDASQRTALLGDGLQTNDVSAEQFQMVKDICKLAHQPGEPWSINVKAYATYTAPDKRKPVVSASLRIEAKGQDTETTTEANLGKTSASDFVAIAHEGLNIDESSGDPVYMPSEQAVEDDSGN